MKALMTGGNFGAVREHRGERQRRLAMGRTIATLHRD
jgi:hypothetical protein